ESSGVGEFAIAVLETDDSRGPGNKDRGTRNSLNELSVPTQADRDGLPAPSRLTNTNAWQVGWLGVAAVLGLLSGPPVRRFLFRRRTLPTGGHEPIRE